MLEFGPTVTLIETDSEKDEAIKSTITNAILSLFRELHQDQQLGEREIHSSIEKWTFEQQSGVQIEHVHEVSELSLAGETGSLSFIELQAGVFETLQPVRNDPSRWFTSGLGTAASPARRPFTPRFLPCAKRPVVL